MKFILLGDNMIDETRHCHVLGISPEAPIPRVEVIKVETGPGGMWNVEANLKALGCDVRGIGYHHYHSVPSFGVIPLGFVEQMERRIRYIDDRTGHQILRVDEHYSMPEDVIGSVQRQTFLGDWVRKNQKDSIHVVISDYNHGAVADLACQEITQAFNGWRKLLYLFCDTRAPETFWQRAKSLTERADKVFWLPNLKEYEKGSEKMPDKVEIIRKESEHGMTHISYQPFHLEALNKHVVDVTGAGDTVISAFSIHYSKYKNIHQAMEFANKVAAFSCSKRGAYAVSLKDLELKKI